MRYQPTLVGMVLMAIGAFVQPASAARTWDVALDGGWMRCLIDVDETNHSLDAKIYPLQLGQPSAMAENLALIDTGLNYVLQGPITSGSFKIGLGKLEFVVGDQFVLTVGKYTGEITLMLMKKDGRTWSQHLKFF